MTRYLTLAEIKAVSDSRSVDGRGWKEVARLVAENLILRIGSVTPELVKSDIRLVLEQHQTADSGHLSVGEKIPGGGKIWFCSHISEWVELSCFGEKEDLLDESLQPVRGFENNAYEPNQDWNLIAFPQYYVVEDESIQNQKIKEAGKTGYDPLTGRN